MTAKYPRVETVIGDLGSFDKIEECSRAADVVINTAPDITHEEAIEAILNGCKTNLGGRWLCGPVLTSMHSESQKLKGLLLTHVGRISDLGRA